MPGKAYRMRNGGTLLVIDESSDTAEVLKAVFEPRGVRVDRYRSRTSARIGKHDAATPAVVVIDSESWQSSDPEEVLWADSPRVIIGKARAAVSAAADNGRSTEFLGKPFQFAELVRTIESMMRGN